VSDMLEAALQYGAACKRLVNCKLENANEQITAALFDEIKRLRAELAVERKRVSSYRTLVSSLESQISRHRANASEAAGAIRTLDSERAANAVLTAELAACQQDAERYRWLRGTVPESSSRWARWRLECWISGAWHELRGLHLDTCIDAARKGEGE